MRDINGMLNLFGHIKGTLRKRWLKKVWERTPPNRRKKEKPRHSWRKYVERAMSARGLTQEDCLKRLRWKLGYEKR